MINYVSMSKDGEFKRMWVIRVRVDTYFSIPSEFFISYSFRRSCVTSQDVFLKNIF